ncbi:unnamed protein product [Paramecium pentaurelia]|uniref:E2 ubiquitin-conjugating enzyme n=1 Tax=Paramecium pentaurelia TaxID=43138 RepID=A0A8S1WUA8_9CILI|nr:unnamed protein product [Paramecium pentaurelia]
MALKRIKREFEEIEKNQPPNYSVSLFNNEDFYQWKAIIVGSEESFYKGGRFVLQINISKKYPFKPPKIRFLTEIYHPNIKSFGQLYFNEITDQWSPALEISKILAIICQLLSNPDPDSPLVPEIAKIYKSNNQLFIQTAQKCVRKYAN